MRDILFRGKDTETGEWKFGSFYYGLMVQFLLDDKKHFIIDGDTSLYYEVIPETIGQDTGLKDKEGRRIFEGDIVSHEGTAYKVFFDKEDAGFYLKYFAGVVRGIYDDVFVIGNTTDNPDFLKGVE